MFMNTWTTCYGKTVTLKQQGGVKDQAVVLPRDSRKGTRWSTKSEEESRERSAAERKLRTRTEYMGEEKDRYGTGLQKTGSAVCGRGESSRRSQDMREICRNSKVRCGMREDNDNVQKSRYRSDQVVRSEMKGGPSPNFRFADGTCQRSLLNQY
ncbi:hypothetical protein HYDPIDRAFT_109543 [Hydnomerulius pinastri MD-312]|nr:hypothetical protein HYDPIDRAFT_109543 [Hydnomerulius pinastri MD-312]